ncbi:unnamed protein product, partial [Didymodactylos carnosus]
MLANLVYLGYAIGILIIDFNPYVNGSAGSSSAVDLSDVTTECSCLDNSTDYTTTISPDQPIASADLVNNLYFGFGIVHMISAFLYWWAWSDHTWLDVIMIPEYLNFIEAGLYIWSAVWYKRETTLFAYYTLCVHKIEITAAFVELLASCGWIMSWYRTYTRTLGRGFSLDDPDTVAYLCTFISSLIYITYNIQITAHPEQYGTNYLYTYGDIVYFVGACYYCFACLRDDSWFWFMPLAGQYGIAAGRLQTEKPIKAGLPH